jgi:probable phosphoglycerate mutase
MIYLVRHGQTEFNRDRRLQGHRESRLTQLGESQARATADVLHHLTSADSSVPWRIISSPLGRTQATAKIIGARLGLPIEIDQRLIEISVGEWEGRLWDELARADPNCFTAKDWVFRAPGGETYEEVMDRVAAWLRAQAGEAARRLIVVSHGVAGRLLRGVYAGLSREEILQQDVPQDAVYRLYQGRLDRIQCV